ncbi:exodeoxyribonuclease III [Rhodococcus opacus RKJ300 = JCM 13270]|uniref:Exodeoxyribonuclease III n=1 Tax=Rhodococcus opacus RKJ300 = JCM 13270 TaxID=1165867 RepID=I0WXI0_RHOOP|nr:exodeoxyribonuclease III [Rhodococcus opacus RKJ300 = JCM 13270]
MVVVAGQSFVKDTGWRIDYHLATPRLAQADE